jgi:hypothetical protein
LESSFSSVLIFIVVVVLTSSSSLTPATFNNDVSIHWCCSWLLPLVERGCYGWQPDNDTNLIVECSPRCRRRRFCRYFPHKRR